MTITELVRQDAFAPSDILSNLRAELQRVIAERDSAEERAKRCGTEITRHRAVESECKRSLDDIGRRVAAAQHVLDELDEKRQAALELLLRSREEEDSVAKSFRAAQDSVAAALTKFTKEQKIWQDSESRVAKLHAEERERQRVLRQTMLHSLDRYLNLQVDRFYAAFDAQEQRAGALHAFEELKKARNVDPEVGRLCEQREELQKFLAEAVVSGVRDMLQESLKRIEDRLRLRFGTALITPPRKNDDPIEELLFYRGEDDKALFFLPIDLRLVRKIHG